jgi:hypothetical protein
MKIARSLVTAAMMLFAMRAEAQGNITGTVYDSLRTHAPLANATVVLVEPSRYATTDARGRFTIANVPNGHYTLGFTHAVLDSLDLQSPLIAVDVAAGKRAVAELATPSAETMYAKLCPGTRDSSTGVVIGRVRDVDNHAPLAGAAVSTDWMEFKLAKGHTSEQRITAATHSSASGVYVLCGVPTDVPVDIKTELDKFIVGPTRLLTDGRVLSRVDFAISKRDSAARYVSANGITGDSAIDAAHRRGTASLRAVVRGTNGKPLREAKVSIFGTAREARTNGEGAFAIDGIPAGTRTIEVLSIGSLPSVFSMDFATNAVRDTSFTLVKLAQQMRTVSVQGRSSTASWMGLSGFEARRMQGLGDYLTDTQIAEHNYPDLAATLRGMRGIRIECNANKNGLEGVGCTPTISMIGVPVIAPPAANAAPSGAAAGSGARAVTAPPDSTSAYCSPAFFLDGVPAIIPISDLNTMITVGQIKGIEVYPAGGTLPAQYMNAMSGCGTILIWTR